MFKKFYIVLFSFIFFFSNLFPSDINLGVSVNNKLNDINTRRQFILINIFKSNSSDILNIVKINIIKNLLFEGIFNIKDAESFSEDNLSDDDWVKSNFDYKLDGSYDNINKNISIKLYSVSSNEKILDKTYNIKNRSLIHVSNEICDDVYFIITGNVGLFSTNIAFSVSNNKKGIEKKSEIYMTNFLGDTLEKITNHNSISILPSFHPKNQKILYTSYIDKNPDLFLFDMQNKKKIMISRKQGLNVGGVFSPCGNKILLSMTLSGSPNIVMLDSSGNFLENITKNRFINVSPTWSNDGEKIAFISDRTGTPQIYIYENATKNVYPITFDTKLKDSLSWSPVNDEIVFSMKYNNKFDIYKINVLTKEKVNLTDFQGNNEDPTWSPDGRFICFTSDRDGKKDLFIMNSDGTNQRKFLDVNGDISAPNWSPCYENKNF